MEFIQRIQEFIDSIRRRIHFLKTNIKVSKLELEIYRHLEEYTREFENRVENELQQLQNIGRNPSVEQVENRLGDMQVYLETELKDKLERIDTNREKLQDALDRFGEVQPYHREFIEKTEEAVEQELKEVQRLEKVINDLIERLDREAEPGEMAELMSELGEEKTRQQLRDVDQNLRQLEEIIEEQKIKKMNNIRRKIPIF